MGYNERREKGDYRWVPETSGIYRLYQGDTVVYVGQTNNLRGRLQEHDRNMLYWGSYDYKSTRYIPTAERKRMEHRAIARNYPTRNKQ
jgi:predicted GIY-YIG superfamily endonuclease